MFFLVNGYLLFRKELNLRKHIIKTVRLTVVTIIWSFIIPVVLCPITGYEPTIKELLSWGWYRTMGWNDQLWFIGALVCIYIFFPILKVAYDKYRPAFLFFAAVCTIMTFGVVLLNQVISVALCGLFNRGLPLRLQLLRLVRSLQGHSRILVRLLLPGRIALGQARCPAEAGSEQARRPGRGHPCHLVRHFWPPGDGSPPA